MDSDRNPGDLHKEITGFLLSEAKKNSTCNMVIHEWRFTVEHPPKTKRTTWYVGAKSTTRKNFEEQMRRLIAKNGLPQ